MQTALKNWIKQSVFSGERPLQNCTTVSTKPLSVSLDSLQFVSGGKGATPPTPSKPTAPNNGW